MINWSSLPHIILDRIFNNFDFSINQTYTYFYMYIYIYLNSNEWSQMKCDWAIYLLLSKGRWSYELIRFIAHLCPRKTILRKSFDKRDDNKFLKGLCNGMLQRIWVASYYLGYLLSGYFDKKNLDLIIIYNNLKF